MNILPDTTAEANVDEDELWSAAVNMAYEIITSPDYKQNEKVRVLGHVLGWRGKVRPKGAANKLARILQLVNEEPDEAVEG